MMPDAFLAIRERMMAPGIQPTPRKIPTKISQNVQAGAVEYFTLRRSVATKPLNGEIAGNRPDVKSMALIVAATIVVDTVFTGPGRCAIGRCANLSRSSRPGRRLTGVRLRGSILAIRPSEGDGGVSWTLFELSAAFTEAESQP
jgi:hypothetical protein